MVHWLTGVMNRRMVAMCAGLAALTGGMPAQQSPPAAAPAPTVITLPDALTRARQYGGQIQSANFAVLQARQDTVQARAARLPSVNAFNQMIYTEGNGTPSGVFVANDGG